MASAAQLLQPKRTTRRMRVLMTGTLFTPDGAQRVLIRDVSRVGVLLGLESKVPVNRDAIFKRGEVFAASQIVWSRGHEARLQFYRELTADEVASTFQPVVL